MKEKWIIGIHVSNRVKKVSRVQEILTSYGCSIRTRLGLPDTENPTGEESGLILLEMTGDPQEFLRMENALLEIENLEVKKMVFWE